MSTKNRRRTKPDDYEAWQVQEIAAWKSEFSNPFGELFRRSAQPVVKVVESIIPDRLARTAVEAAYRAARAMATEADVRLLAGVDDVRELQRKPLELCDRLAAGVGETGMAIAAAEGFTTGAGGVWTTVLDVPLLFVSCLRTIVKIGHCYGYPMDRKTDEAWTLGALAVALSCTPERRAGLLERVREVEDLMIEETEEQVLIEESAALLTQIELFEDVPVFGAATGALLNLWTARKVERTARRLFQERWLRDNGRVASIEPLARVQDAASAYGWSGALTRAAAGTAYGVGFCAAFPFHFVAEGLSSFSGRLPTSAAATGA